MLGAEHASIYISTSAIGRYGLLNFYKRETASYGWQGAVRRYFPKLCDGVAGSAVHGLIQVPLTAEAETCGARVKKRVAKCG
jgi:hypothetical protein